MGLVFSWFVTSFPPKSHFTANDIPDLSDKVIIVTGANTGIGKETAKALLSHNAKVYIAARSQEKAEQAIADLKEQTGKEARFLQLDLSDLKSVKAAAETFQRQETELHVLFNNAGVMMPPMDELTAQGYDLQVGTNTLGPFYFTKLLLPNLLAGAQSSLDGNARVVNSASWASLLVPDIDFNAFRDGPARRKANQRMYAYSKLGNVLFSKELARKYGDKGIISTSLNPGNIVSDLQRTMSLTAYIMLKPFLSSTAQGAVTQLWAGTSPEGLALNGKYLVPWAREGTANPISNDVKLAQDLWEWMEEQVKDI
ncbi:hypothetical protein CPB84DRAFT_1781782 [Gymnopilus junonius]|uniref:NAD(P)-binding protein n=1 Tax=Gymnopilus junonius TaxID=109634 RepID=A0A9P5NIS8_GYMJU|nr:hypothetical protein CPB84DRAFT_1781782 [Gymnopilus junonius]